ncbi:MAG: arylsulfatase [Acidobacteria bacterium]|nr:arylsulfatase [Acidobacteriota bacterium]
MFILADDLGYGEVGFQGQHTIRTPNIDRLAAEGMRFTNAYSGATVCAPSRSTLMSGLHTGHSPVRANGGGNPLVPEDVTVAEVLKQAGYRTGCFGKWGLGDIGTAGVPWEQGFDEFFGYLHQVHAHYFYPEYLWKNGEKYPLEGNDRSVPAGLYSADVIHAQAMDFLHSHVRQSQALAAQAPDGEEVPFFLYLAYTPPHGEYQVPEESAAEYAGKFPEKPIEARGDHAAQAEPYATYAGMITRLDGYVGEVMAALDDLGVEKDTLVVFTSDNGPSPPNGDLELFDSNGPLRGRKGQLYEGGIRAPFAVRWPGRVPAGTSSDVLTSFWDFLPTAAELAGAPVPPGLDGISLVPTLTGQGEQVPREYLYWEHPGADVSTYYRAARMANWKGIRNGADAALELYDLERDPGESADVAEANPDVADRLAAILEEAHAAPRPHFQKGWNPENE